MAKISFRMSDRLYESINFLYKKDNESLSETIRRLLESFIDHDQSRSIPIEDNMLEIQIQLQRMEKNYSDVNQKVSELHMLIAPLLKEINEETNTNSTI